MSIASKTTSAINLGPMATYGHRDPEYTYSYKVNTRQPGSIKVGIVEQFNVGLYSARVIAKGEKAPYVCLIGAQNATPGFGYSDSTVLREGDEVIFCVDPSDPYTGMILAKKPTIYSKDKTHQVKVKSKTKLDTRTHFFSNDCYRPKSPAYHTPLVNKSDKSTRRYMNRPTDLVPGEIGTLNQHGCGMLGGMYSMTMKGGGAHIRMFSLENRIRIVADSIMQHTLVGNTYEWHNRRYLSEERALCMYQEERLGMNVKGQTAFKTADYKEDGYFTQNMVKRQTLKPRYIDQTGFYGNLMTKYCLRPDPDLYNPRTLDDRPNDPGVARESIDPSGQYRLAATGMLGFERIGRIPVPVRITQPWRKEAEEPSEDALTAFQHDEDHPYYRQLELADRVAYDLKNSYARTDAADKEFYTPEEKDLENKVRDVYDEGFTDSSTVKLEKYDKRRSGVWQGEDGSIILRDAWGSEIVMIGGNIQLSCAGNIEILPGKSSLTLAGDDIVVKAQNSIDIEAADRDVRINAYKNVQVLAGVDDSNPGGITLEAKGQSGPWDIETPDGGEGASTRGIFLKADKGNVVTDVENLVLKADKYISVVAGKDKISGGEGTVLVAAHGVYSYGDQIISTTEDSTMILTDSVALLDGSNSALLCGGSSAAVVKGDEAMVPLTWAGVGNIHSDISDSMSDFRSLMTNTEKVAQGYDENKLEKMYFRFRSSSECSTERSWELGSSGPFTLYQPFWNQVIGKFETLQGGVASKEFDDHVDDWDEKVGNPWPGTKATKEGKYAMLSNETPVNMDENGMNVARKEVVNKTAVIETNLMPGYRVRQ